jgi:hypothetical protein
MCMYVCMYVCEGNQAYVCMYVCVRVCNMYNRRVTSFENGNAVERYFHVSGSWSQVDVE